MADTNLHPKEADAFLYISASHNPIGHNGFKFEKKGVYMAPRMPNALPSAFVSWLATV